MHYGLVMSVQSFKLENRWTDLDEISYGLYAYGDYSEIVHFNFFQSIITCRPTKKLATPLKSLSHNTGQLLHVFVVVES